MVDKSWKIAVKMVRGMQICASIILTTPSRLDGYNDRHIWQIPTKMHSPAVAQCSDDEDNDQR